MPRNRFPLLFIFALLFSACSPQPQPLTLTVMAAASLNGAFTELGARFEAQHPGVKVQFNFAGSQQLAQQLHQGAPADVFASANQKQMDGVVDSGRIEPGAGTVFARNRLVVIFPKENPAAIKRLDDLGRPGQKLIFAAKEVPVGQYSLDFLDKAAGGMGAGYKESVLANVVSYEDNVRAVLTKVALGEADAGIVYSSDVAGADAQKVGQVAIPDEWNIIAAYPIAALKDSAHQEMAQAFVSLVLADEGQAVLAQYGFLAKD